MKLINYICLILIGGAVYGNLGQLLEITDDQLPEGSWMTFWFHIICIVLMYITDSRK